MKTIVVTTDLSDESKLAFAPARELAKALGAKLLLLAVVADPAQAAMIYSLDLPVYPDPEVQKQVLEKVNGDLTAMVKEHFAGIDCEPFAAEAKQPVHAEILSFARARSADMIVIATHGRTGLVHMLIGSVAERVVRESHCPVLTVPIAKKTEEKRS